MHTKLNSAPYKYNTIALQVYETLQKVHDLRRIVK